MPIADCRMTIGRDGEKGYRPETIDYRPKMKEDRDRMSEVRGRKSEDEGRKKSIYPLSVLDCLLFLFLASSFFMLSAAGRRSGMVPPSS